MKSSGYGDQALDYKGPYRNLFTDITREWWGSSATQGFPLFLPAETQSASYDDRTAGDRYSWVPNCSCSNDVYLELYRLIGQLIGCILYSDIQVFFCFV